MSAIKVKIKGYDKLEIDVTEKKLFGCVLLSDNRMAYFDEDGKVVEVSDRVIENVMQVSGTPWIRQRSAVRSGWKKTSYPSC